MNKELRFGFTESDILLLRTNLEPLLGIAFEERESSYFGGRYFRFKSPTSGEYILQRNFDSGEHEWIEESHQDLALLLDISDAPNSESFKKILASIQGSRLIVETER